ncbi:hypothetical protein RhiXN_05407 [Rhizoctonia solani]|uniref:Uncharacterized protein n=1 Tax=Rhizoctonia solani TaxID=456999 RepID=A0A8H8NQE2_9AGAM|nr:uncharacterized protein RhiXN_05407 [Rhizoctonia solani]QRW17405.1 hypothetical protein RhiXN_05407 [Rhizoctonia solani]
MLAILEPFCPLTTMVGTKLPSASSRLVSQLESPTAAGQANKGTVPLHSLTEIVTEPEAKQVILDMLGSGTPESVIRSIFETGYYEIAVPPRSIGVPYIAITYTNDEQEGYIYDMNSQPPQHLDLLTVPRPGMTTVERDEDENEAAWDRLQWGSIDYLDDSGEVDSIPWPVLYTNTDFEDLEAVSGLEIYFSGSSDRSWGLCTPIMNNGIEPWRLSRASTSQSAQLDMWARDWSEDYELGDAQHLIVADDDEDLEQDSSAGSNSSSDSEMEWFRDVE